VFASGSGTNLGSLLDNFGPDGSPDPSARIALLVTDRPGIRSLERADAAGVPARVIVPGDYETREAFAAALLDGLREHEIELIALAGYLKLVPARVIETYRGRIVNIHPGPLPTFGGPGMYGHHVHEAVIASGVRISGPTIHFVDERYDTGPIIAQWPVPVLAGDTPDSLAGRVLRHEHRLYPAVLRALARGEIRLEEDGRVVRRGVSGGGEPGFRLAGLDASLESVKPF
jgi:formyltetrahydrofolate-dependent phosphoribosylglycinamide formyltransferase